MDRKEFTISGRDCMIYADPDPEYLLVRPFADHDEKGLDEEVRRIRLYYNEQSGIWSMCG